MIHSLADVGRVLEPGARLEPSKAPPCALLPPAQPHHRLHILPETVPLALEASVQATSLQGHFRFQS